MEKKITVSKESQGKRLDKFLVAEFKDFSRSKLNSLIVNGQVLVDGSIKKPHFSLRCGQSVQVKFQQQAKTLKGYNFPIDIIYEDSDIIVVDKPTGLVVHPPQNGYHETLVNALIYLGKDLAKISDLRPGVVHRLDKETSGIMVLAKNEQSYKNLVEQFKQRKVKKEYLAWVWGQIKKDRLNVDLPLSRDLKNRLKMKVSFLKAKQAYTKIEVISRLKEATQLRLLPVTGRMHQLRVHLKFLGYPIVGDKKYGIKDDCKQLLLHSRFLSLAHPQTKKLLKFTSSIPERFEAFARKHNSI